MTETELMLSLLMEFEEERLSKYINARKAFSKVRRVSRITCFNWSDTSDLLTMK